MKPKSEIHLHIGRLVIDGDLFSAAHSAKLQASIVTELTRLLAGGGLAHHLSGGTVLASVPAGEIRPPSSAVSDLGTRIAQTVYRGIGQ